MAFPRATLPGFPPLVPTARDVNNQHTIHALAHLREAQTLRARYDRLLHDAIAQFGNTHTAAISGVYAEHFPDDVKDQLRTTAHAIGVHVAHAYTCWHQAGRRAATLRPLAQEARTLPDGRISYY